MRFIVPFRSAPSTALFCASFALASAISGCGIDVSAVFTSGQGAQAGASSGGSGAGGSTGGNAPGGSTTTTPAGGSTTTTPVGGSTTTTPTGGSTTTTPPTFVCGDGKCDSALGETNALCPQDCAGACAHSICEGSQTPLDQNCDPCVVSVCAQNPDCCNKEWSGACIGLVNQLCNNACCGDGQCVAEQCDACVADCGTCPPAPTCAHSICKGSDNAAPLNTASCFDPCIDLVCANINATTDNCCQPEPPAWSAECTDVAHNLCPEYTCIKDVCAAMPTCCTGHWTAACVAKAVDTPSCNTSCDCANDPCTEGQGNTPLDAGCDPCVAAVCAADPYCCNNDWDGICVGEVATLCGLQCN